MGPDSTSDGNASSLFAELPAQQGSLPSMPIPHNPPAIHHGIPSLQTLAEAAEVDADNRSRDLKATAALVARDIQASTSHGTQTPANLAQRSLAAQISGVSGSMSVADGGQLRWYGPTSNRHFSIGASPLSENNAEKTMNQVILEALHRSNETVDLTSRLENRLLSLYWIWHNSFFYIVHQELFMKHKARYMQGEVDCPFFSLTLYYAILAYSAIFSDEAISLADGVVERSGDVYSRKARICLEAEMDHPRETTVQALAIMSSYEVCVGRDARG